MVLRSLLLAVMVFVAMPWGAFSAVYPALAAPSHVVSGDASSLVAKPASVERPRKRCRTATLPGSPCAQDVRLDDGIALTAPVGEVVRPLSHDTMLRSGGDKPPPQGPPRLI